MNDDDLEWIWIGFETQTVDRAPEQNPDAIALLFAEANQQVCQLVRDLTLNGAIVDLQTTTNGTDERPLGTSMVHTLTVHVPCNSSKRACTRTDTRKSPKVILQLITNGTIRAAHGSFFLQRQYNNPRFAYCNAPMGDLKRCLHDEMLAFSKSNNIIRQVLDTHPNNMFDYMEFYPENTTEFRLYFKTPRMYFAGLSLTVDHDTTSTHFTTDAGLVGIISNRAYVHTPFTDKDSLIHNLDVCINAAVVVLNPTPPPTQTQLLERLINFV
jgi:hypothetical protein